MRFCVRRAQPFRPIRSWMLSWNLPNLVSTPTETLRALTGSERKMASTLSSWRLPRLSTTLRGSATSPWLEDFWIPKATALLFPIVRLQTTLPYWNSIAKGPSEQHCQKDNLLIMLSVLDLPSFQSNCSFKMGSLKTPQLFNEHPEEALLMRSNSLRLIGYWWIVNSSKK